MIRSKEDFFTSGWSFDESERDLRSKVQMINIALVLSSFGLLYGIAVNYFRDVPDLIPLELFLLVMNSVLFFTLRASKEYFGGISNIITVQFTFLFLYLVYTSNPIELKHIWIFTYPIILLYFQNEKNAILWVIFTISMLLVAPLQPFIEVQYTLYQIIYLIVVLVVVSMIIYFYQRKMDEAKALILSQQDMLKSKVDELTHKDKLLTLQSKQAVMGEMISMVAHQWRQPLSTVTLSISNLQVKKLLGEEIEEDVIDKTLENISETIVYLSETIDDFQTYFRPNRDINQVEINELVRKAINFALPRVKDTNIKISFNTPNRIVIQTYTNELIQVLLNILNNAVDELISKNIHNPLVDIDIENASDALNIYIKDNAGGIKNEHLEKIFEPYFSTKGKNGTGLGLYMSQMIMHKQFNSLIEVQTNSDGSVFTIKVPKKLA